MRYSAIAILFSILVGCGAEMTGDNNVTETSKHATFTGAVLHDGIAISEVEVVALNAENQSVLAHTVTDEFGNFELAVPEKHTNYDIIVGKIDTRGVYTMQEGTQVSFDAPDDGSSYDIGVYNLEYVELSEDQLPEEMTSNYSTIQAPLGAGKGCMAAGCTAKCWKGIRYLLCGYSVCFFGMQLPFPYWYSPC